MKTAILLGAGASSSEGAPLQNQIFKEYFKSVRDNHAVHHEIERELATFFYLMFNIDVDNDDLDNAIFPTFEEALGILDLAERRRESLKDFDLENIASNSNRIRFIRQYLVLVMAKVLHDKLEVPRGHHKQLVKSLRDSDNLKDTIFISTNYDILIDNALAALYPQFMLDYGVDFTNFERTDDWKRPSKNPVNLYKIHGSLNWLYCPTCNSLTLTPKEKGVIRLLTDFSHSACSVCESVIVPIIVPPTFYKDMSNVFLSIIWNRAEQSLRMADHIIFCGYSFPDADMHVKYLIKRIQTNRRQPMRFTVINNHPRKLESVSHSESERYKRFLGPLVTYTDKSFEEFCCDPSSYFKSPHQRITRPTTTLSQ
jgi:NAD-dependent SIR2 family protein deacetylase